MKKPCKEHWDTLPYSSEHLWEAGIHGEATGNCHKCGMPISQWMAKLERKMGAYMKGDTMTLRAKIEKIIGNYEPHNDAMIKNCVDAILEAVREDEQELIDYFESGLLKRLKEENENN